MVRNRNIFLLYFSWYVFPDRLKRRHRVKQTGWFYRELPRLKQQWAAGWFSFPYGVTPSCHKLQDSSEVHINHSFMCEVFGLTRSFTAPQNIASNDTKALIQISPIDYQIHSYSYYFRMRQIWVQVGFRPLTYLNTTIALNRLRFGRDRKKKS